MVPERTVSLPILVGWAQWAIAGLVQMEMDLSEHPKLDQMYRGLVGSRSGFQLEHLSLASSSWAVAVLRLLCALILRA